ncbi:MAG: hypothetical protein OXK80_00475 [Bdellovibrionales bacterium]|nr:hypothetical protein [Bdellovibrionales bacterium]
MPLTLDSLLWVLPGICFLFAYHRLRDVESVEFSNWNYVFFIVFIGVITILPIRYLFNEQGSTTFSFEVLALSTVAGFLLPFIIKFTFIPFVDKLEKEPNFFIPSTFWSIIYFFFPLENRDKFIKNCIEYEGEAVLITVDEPILFKGSSNKTPSDKKDDSNETITNIKSTVFLGILIEFPYVATNSIDSQVIRILPLLRGYYYIEKNKGEEKIKWIRKYTPEDDSLGTIIPRNKIIHFCLYDEKQHDDIIFQ